MKKFRFYFANSEIIVIFVAYFKGFVFVEIPSEDITCSVQSIKIYPISALRTLLISGFFLSYASELQTEERPRTEKQVNMYSTFHEHSNYINVPIRLINPRRWNRSVWDLLVLACCLKLRSGDSGLYVHTPYDLMKAINCSYSKAERLLKQASKSELFHYNPKTHFLCAKSFKKGADWFEDRKGNRMYHDDVIAAEKEPDGTISHYKLSRQLRDKLMLRMLSAKESSDELQRQPNLGSEARKQLTHKYLANVAGVSRSTATRHLNKLSKGDDRILNVTTHEKIAVYDIEHGLVLNEIPNRKSFISGRFAYVRDANEYSFLDGNHSKHFKHIIYNHKKRRTDNRVVKFHWEL